MTRILTFKILTCLSNPKIVLKAEYRPLCCRWLGPGCSASARGSPVGCGPSSRRRWRPDPLPVLFGRCGTDSQRGKRPRGSPHRGYLTLGEPSCSSAAAAGPCAYPSPQQPGLVSSLPAGSAGAGSGSRCVCGRATRRPGREAAGGRCRLAPSTCWT